MKSSSLAGTIQYFVSFAVVSSDKKDMEWEPAEASGRKEDKRRCVPRM